jgi:hypothetical protein
MDEYGTSFTIEFQGSKGWEVCYAGTSLNDAINEYRRLLLSDFGVYRLTSPTDIAGTYGIS